MFAILAAPSVVAEYKALMADAKRVMIRAQKEYTIVSTGGGHADADTVSSSELS